MPGHQQADLTRKAATIYLTGWLYTLEQHACNIRPQHNANWLVISKTGSYGPHRSKMLNGTHTIQIINRKRALGSPSGRWILTIVIHLSKKMLTDATHDLNETIANIYHRGYTLVGAVCYLYYCSSIHVIYWCGGESVTWVVIYRCCMFLFSSSKDAYWYNYFARPKQFPRTLNSIYW